MPVEGHAGWMEIQDVRRRKKWKGGVRSLRMWGDSEGDGMGHAWANVVVVE